MTKDEKIAKLGKEITDRATVLLGKDKITPDAPEYLGINSALKFTAVKYDEKMADDILDIALTMKKRVPLTIEQLAKKNPQFDRAYLEKAMQAISESGLVEFHWENLDGKNPNHEKRWVLDMFVPGSAEIMMINPEQADMFPETADFFERMAYLPLAGITEMVPPGGAGVGMHVIPVEKAIPAESKSLPIEHLSHWLKKYEGHIGVSVCSCRKQQRIRGEGIVEYDRCLSSHTIALPDGTYCYCTLDCAQPLGAFLPAAQAEVARVKAAPSLNDGADPDELFFVSSLPWLTFSAISLPTPTPADSNPRITFGKFTQEGDRVLLPVNLTANHALVDGLHLAAFFDGMAQRAAHPEEYF